MMPPGDELRGGKNLTLVTGASGLLGSHIMAALLRRGDRVAVIIRDKGTQSAKQRFEALCDFIEIDPRDRARAVVLDGSLEKPHFGLDDPAFAELCSLTARVIHCAASTSFSARNREQSERVNITGLGHALEFAQLSGCEWFHQMSTVYVAGAVEGRCEEKLFEPGAFTNVYEETKSRGERLVSEFCGSRGIKYTILRPSIIVGDSRNGKTLRFNGLYYPLKALLFIRDVFAHDCEQAARMGISFENGTSRIPLRIQQKNSGGLNLIPIDFAVEAITRILDRPRNGNIYQIAAREPVSLSDIVKFSARFFNIRGIEMVGPDFFSTHERTPLEQMFHSCIGPYLPYMEDNRIFSTVNTDRLLTGTEVICPVFDYDLFSRCMKFALDTKWGKTLS